MIGHFPDPYPDELLYSICARFSDRMKFPSKKSVSRDFFGTSNVTAVVDLPSHLDSLIAALPPGSSYTTSTLIDDHTLLPFYGPFLPMDRLDRIRQDMCGHGGAAIASRIGTVASGIPLPLWLRFCPQCVEEDRRHFGECYWHRFHQVPGVLVCPTHAILLQNSEVPAVKSRRRFEVVPAEYGAEKATREVVSVSSSHFSFVLRIAKDAAWLLKQQGLKFGPESLQKKYIAHLARIGMVTRHGKVRTEGLIRAFKNFYPPHFLKELHCDLEDQMNDSWFTRLVRPSRNSARTQHPIHHILFIQFLGLEVEEFFQSPIEHKPFGDGPWPCLNPVSNHNRQYTIPECTFIYDSRIVGRVIGTFSCHCGFTYTRQGPDTSLEGQYQLSSVQSRGEAWKASLKQFWEDPNVNLTHAAVELGVTRKTVQYQANLLGLPETKSKKHGSNKSIVIPPKNVWLTENEIESHRTIWLAALTEYSEEGLQVIWRKPNLLRTYRLLVKYDSEWQKIHMPPQKPWEKRLSPLPPRVNWDTRDDQLAESVKASAQRLKSVPGRPKQVSITAIARDINASGLIQKRLYKLPLTAAALTEVAETYEDCGARRIWWATKLYQQEGIIPSRQQLIRRAYVRDMLEAPEVIEAIDSALLTFSVPEKARDL